MNRKQKVGVDSNCGTSEQNFVKMYHLVQKLKGMSRSTSKGTCTHACTATRTGHGDLISLFPFTETGTLVKGQGSPELISEYGAQRARL